eukprot:scaffold118341_cov63-Phaeocystis_antarctica.AAC.3
MQLNRVGASGSPQCCRQSCRGEGSVGGGDGLELADARGGHGRRACSIRDTRSRPVGRQAGKHARGRQTGRWQASRQAGRWDRLLRENEDIRQIVPKVEDELQVRVGLARAAGRDRVLTVNPNLAVCTPIVRQHAVVRKSVVIVAPGAAVALVWRARLQWEAHAWAAARTKAAAELWPVAHEVQR